jgi:hypothetical protein
VGPNVTEPWIHVARRVLVNRRTIRLGPDEQG